MREIDPFATLLVSWRNSALCFPSFPTPGTTWRGRGDVEVKRKLAKAINAMLDPIRERRAEVLAQPGRVRDILLDGSSRARVIAQETMRQVRDALKLTYS